MAITCALSVLPTPRLAPALAQARAYLLGRQCTNGGFSFYRSEYLEEPNTHDTWHALAALQLLGAPPPRWQDIVRFVVDQSVAAQPYGLYFRVRSLCLLDTADPAHAAAREAVAALTTAVPDLDRLGDPTNSLYQLRLVLWLKRHFGLAFPARDLSRHLIADEHPDGGFGVPPNLLATRQALAVLALCEAPAPAQAGCFVSRLAIPDFGFRLTADSLAPNLETTCAGIACCHRLHLPIVHAADAQVFILDCQTGDGSFARAPSALPDIALTHLALAGLDVLAGPLHF
jgi:prenyltransferase beta subunit